MAPLLPEKRIAATWSDSGSVHIWDITKHALLIDTPGGVKGGSKPIADKPIYSFTGHQVQGWGGCECEGVGVCVRVCESRGVGLCGECTCIGVYVCAYTPIMLGGGYWCT